METKIFKLKGRPEILPFCNVLNFPFHNLLLLWMSECGETRRWQWGRTGLPSVGRWGRDLFLKSDNFQFEQKGYVFLFSRLIVSLNYFLH